MTGLVARRPQRNQVGARVDARRASLFVYVDVVDLNGRAADARCHLERAYPLQLLLVSLAGPLGAWLAELDPARLEQLERRHGRGGVPQTRLDQRHVVERDRVTRERVRTSKLGQRAQQVPRIVEQ
ncbi:MAG: hypothetical protein QM756_16735 [Polyangiaceae bacterium]